MPRSFLIKKHLSCRGNSPKKRSWTEVNNDVIIGTPPIMVPFYPENPAPFDLTKKATVVGPELDNSFQPLKKCSETHHFSKLTSPTESYPNTVDTETSHSSGSYFYRSLVSQYSSFGHSPCHLDHYNFGFLGQLPMSPPKSPPLYTQDSDRFPSKLFLPSPAFEKAHLLSPTPKLWSTAKNSSQTTWFQNDNNESLLGAPLSPESEGDTTRDSNSTAVMVSRTQTTNSRYQCLECEKSYSTYSGLSKHQQFHCETNAKKSFSCKHCDKVYVSLGALKMHIRTHTLPCKCSVCGKAFSRPWLLQGHVRTHTGEKPFSCPHCNRAFADRSNLRAHLQTHSDVKKYKCKTCNKTFSRMSLLVKHEDGVCVSVSQQQ
ncbi:uncharacterized protein LOC143258156 [Tachypleus tridentatus]|uniref:uncharacterized protein LOC143258156 n=1 Tax=Tachypleus tridentatus TaxID=6853 RepID=UPI003FD34473